MSAPPTVACPHYSQWGSKSHMCAIRQCNSLERPVTIEQPPETPDISERVLLPGDVHIFEEEIFNSLGIGRAHKVVYEDLKVLQGG